MATNFSPVLGGFTFCCNVCNEGILHISQLSNTGPSWPSCFLTLPKVKIFKAFADDKIKVAKKLKTAKVE